MSNKTFIKALIFLLLISFNTPKIWGQNLKKDFETLQSLYQNLENFHTKMEVNIYDLNKNTAEPYLQKHCEISKMGTALIYHIDEMSMMKNSKELIMIDHQSKYLFWGEPSKKVKKQKVKDLMLPNIDSLLTLYETIDYKGIKNGAKVYHLKFKNLTFSRAILAIDEKTGFIKKLSYGYEQGIIKQKIWVETIFESTSAAPDFDKRIFKKSFYLKTEGAACTPLGAYKAYKVSQLKTHHFGS